ncbi:uncharacterized protein C8Q71DRAFT_879588, partial [Rhodofomes roseus]
PLVDPEHLKAHLGLLGAFKELRQRVESCSDDYLPQIAQFLDGPQRWAWFVGLAVERFHRWVKHVKHTELATWVMEEVPPLDVLMIWHAYMLNPIWYAEDCDRIPVLATLRSLDSSFIPAVILMDDLTLYEPCEERMLSWFEQTDTPFDPLSSMSCLLYRAVRCPRCGRMNDVPFLDNEGLGYSQRGFRYACVCGIFITKTALAMDKFAGDVVSHHRPIHIEPDKCLAGTLHTRDNSRDWNRAVAIKTKLIGDPGSVFRPAHKVNPQFLVFVSDDDIQRGHAQRVENARLGRVLNAYTDDRPFSVDLAAAVLRQGKFIEEMDNLGWLAQGYFDCKQNEILLAHALARYHAFLDMLSSASTSYFVPTLDIDLVWHTHQLKGDGYMKDSKEFVGWYVDHDDRVEEINLAQGLDETCRVWQASRILHTAERYGLPYMHCGCPLPDETMSSKLHQFTRRLGSSKDNGALQPPPLPSATEATHASEHNAVRAAPRKIHPSYAAANGPRELRALELRRRRERDGRRVLEGKMDEELYRRGQAHISTYLMPLPFAQAGPGPTERYAAPCVVTFPGAYGTTGVGTCIVGINRHL